MPDLGLALLIRAHNAIGEHFGAQPQPAPDHSALDLPGASFVTLTQAGNLRGCIGTLEAWRPLAIDIAENALAAAFRDPRFAPLRAAEFPATRIEVSLLSAPEPWPVENEEDACRRLRPHVDGVILAAGERRATFLPQVWDDLPDPHDFLRHLKYKAGLPPEGWSPDIQLQRYQVQKWKE